MDAPITNVVQEGVVLLQKRVGGKMSAELCWPSVSGEVTWVEGNFTDPADALHALSEKVRGCKLATVTRMDV